MTTSGAGLMRIGRLVSITLALASCYEFRTVADASGTDANLDAPRPIAPISTAWVPSRAPLFSWEATPDTDVRLEVCRDRDCRTVIRTADVTGTHWRPDADLPSGVLFWHLARRTGSAVSSDWSPTWELAIRARSGPSDSVVGALIDVNGDGFGDVVVGAPAAAGGVGAVFVYLGGTAGLSSDPSFVLDAPGPSVLAFGKAVSSAGDIDGDGFGDLAVGAPFSEGRTGYVFVYSGGPAFTPSAPSAMLSGPDGGGGQFGWFLTSVGDADRDGYGDLAVTASAAGDGGRVHVFSGGPRGIRSQATTSLTAVGGSQFGQTLSTGDVNGDGFGDLMVADAGWLNYSGRAWEFHGGVSGLDSVPASVIDPGTRRETFGAIVSSTGDYDSDGFTDFATISMGAPNGGRAYVFRGGSSGVEATASTLIDSPDTAGPFAQAAFTAGDVNSDGFDDLLLCGVDYLNETGRVHLYLGGPGGVGSSPADVWIGPDGEGSRFGLIAAALGDVDGDSIDDFAIAAPARSGAGHVYVFTGSSAGAPMAPRWVLERPDALGFGDGLARAR